MLRSPSRRRRCRRLCLRMRGRTGSDKASHARARTHEEREREREREIVPALPAMATCALIFMTCADSFTHSSYVPALPENPPEAVHLGAGCDLATKSTTTAAAPPPPAGAHKDQSTETHAGYERHTRTETHGDSHSERGADRDTEMPSETHHRGWRRTDPGGCTC
eukprot:COSAG03_NODE_1304_length_4358_cov_20.600141_1_plen_165_part_00